MKLATLLAELHRILPQVGEDAEVDVSGLYSSSGEIEQVDFEVKRTGTQRFVNGQMVESTERNESTVTLKTNLYTG